MTSDYCLGLVCFIPLEFNASTPKIFGFSEYLTGLAFMVIVWTLGDVRYHFRIRTAPIPLYKLTFYVMVALGILTLLTDLWRSEQWLVPHGNLLTPAGWQAILGGLFLLTFLSWSWFAFIRSPIYGKSNAKRYAETLYQIILKGSPLELSIIADEFSRSVPSLIRYAPEKNELRNIHNQAAANYANEILLLIADKKFCRAIVESSPGTARVIFKEMENTQKYSISIGIFFRNIINDALRNKDSFLFHETDVYDTGMIGHLKPISIAMFSNYKMVEEIGEFTSWSRLDSKQWDAEQLQAYCRIVLLIFQDYIEKGYVWSHSYTLNNAIGTIGHAVFDLYFGSEEIQTNDTQDKLQIIVRFIREAIQILEKNNVPGHIQWRMPKNVVRKTIYDHIAEMIVTVITSASGVRSPSRLCWLIQHNLVWVEFFGLTGLDGAASKVIKYKVRRHIYDEVTKLRSFPNFKGTRILGFCLNVMGFNVKNQDDRDYKALQKAILSWTKNNYAWLYFYNSYIAKECLVDNITYQAERLRLVKTWPAEGTRPKPTFLYFLVNPPSQDIE